MKSIFIISCFWMLKSICNYFSISLFISVLKSEFFASYQFLIVPRKSSRSDFILVVFDYLFI